MTPYRDGSVIIERNYHLDRLALAIGVIGIAGFLVGIFSLGHNAPPLPAGCRDSINELGWFTSTVQCAPGQRMENLGYDRVGCWCKGDEPKAGSSSTVWMQSGAGDVTWMPLPNVVSISDAGATWRAVP